MASDQRSKVRHKGREMEIECEPGAQWGCSASGKLGGATTGKELGKEGKMFRGTLTRAGGCELIMAWFGHNRSAECSTYSVLQGLT